MLHCFECGRLQRAKSSLADTKASEKRHEEVFWILQRSFLLFNDNKSFAIQQKKPSWISQRDLYTMICSSLVLFWDIGFRISQWNCQYCNTFIFLLYCHYGSDVILIQLLNTAVTYCNYLLLKECNFMMVLGVT